MPIVPSQAQTELKPGFRLLPRGSKEEAYSLCAQETVQLDAGLFPKLSFLDDFIFQFGISLCHLGVIFLAADQQWQIWTPGTGPESQND